MSLYSELFYSRTVNELFTDVNSVKRMLHAESALIQAQARAGIVPPESAAVISECCNVNLFDLKKLKSDIPLGGNAAIPLVKQLTRIVKNNDFESSKFVHLGATSQDIIDTASILALSKFSDWLETMIDGILAELHDLTDTHRSSVMIGRTLMQHARPVTFGLKAAGWLQGVLDARRRLGESRNQVARIQLGGAVGGGGKFISGEVRVYFAEILSLADSVPWQTNRGNLAAWLSSLSVLTVFLGKIARDIALLMQTEVGEVSEGFEPGKGVSSTMPHKRNPVTCSLIIANAQRIPPLLSTFLSASLQENERSAGLWHAEWETMEQIICLAAGAAEKTLALLTHLEVDTRRMRANLELTRGLIYAENISLALAAEMGKGQAHEWVEEQCRRAMDEGRHLKDVLETSGKEIPDLNNLFDPAGSVEHAQGIIDQIINDYEDQL